MKREEYVLLEKILEKEMKQKKELNNKLLLEEIQDKMSKDSKSMDNNIRDYNEDLKYISFSKNLFDSTKSSYDDSDYYH